MLFHLKLLLVLIVYIFIVLHFYGIIKSVITIVKVVIWWRSVHNDILQVHMVVFATISLLISLQSSDIIFCRFVSLLQLFMWVLKLIGAGRNILVTRTRQIHMLVKLFLGKVHLLPHHFFHFINVIGLFKIYLDLINIDFILFSVSHHQLVDLCLIILNWLQLIKIWNLLNIR